MSQHRSGIIKIFNPKEGRNEEQKNDTDGTIRKTARW